jgi:hypothetical protein
MAAATLDGHPSSGGLLRPMLVVRAMPPEPPHQGHETQVAAVWSLQTIDALGSERNQLVNGHVLLRRVCLH